MASNRKWKRSNNTQFYVRESLLHLFFEIFCLALAVCVSHFKFYFATFHEVSKASFEVMFHGSYHFCPCHFFIHNFCILVKFSTLNLKNWFDV